MKTIEPLNDHFEKLGDNMKKHTPATYMGAFLWCFDAPLLNAFVYYKEVEGCDPQTAHLYASQYAYKWNLLSPEDPCNKGEWEITPNSISLVWESGSGKEYHIQWEEGEGVQASYPENSLLASSFKNLAEAQDRGIMPPPAVPVGYTAYVKDVRRNLRQGRRIRG